LNNIGFQGVFKVCAFGLNTSFKMITSGSNSSGAWTIHSRSSSLSLIFSFSYDHSLALFPRFVIIMSELKRFWNFQSRWIFTHFSHYSKGSLFFLGHILHTHMYIHNVTCIHLSINTCIHTYTCIDTFIHTYTYVHIHNIYMQTYIYTCKRIHTYLHPYVYGNIHTGRCSEELAGLGKGNRLCKCVKVHDCTC